MRLNLLEVLESFHGFQGTIWRMKSQGFWGRFSFLPLIRFSMFEKLFADYIFQHTTSPIIFQHVHFLQE